MFRKLRQNIIKKSNGTEVQTIKGSAKGADHTAITPPPTVAESAQMELSSYKPLSSSGGVDNLIATLINSMPEFAVVAKTEGFDAKVKAMRELPSESHERLFASLITVGFQLQKTGRLEEALKFHKLELEIIKLKPETETSSFFGNTQPRNMADALQSIGLVYSDMGKFSLALQSLLEAEQLYDKDIALRAKRGIKKESEFDILFHPTDIRAALFGNVAALYRELGNQKAAEEYDKKAWSHANTKKTEEALFEELIGQGNYYRKTGDHEKALEKCNEALELALKLRKSTVTSRDVVVACIAVGDIYADLKLYRRAIEYYERSLELNRLTMHYGRMINDYIRIGSVHEAKGNLEGALKSYQEALRYCSVKHEPVGMLDTTSNIWEYEGSMYQIVRPDEAWDILHRLGKVERVRNRLSAVKYLELAINVIESLRTHIIEEEQRISYQGSIVDVYETMIELQLELYEQGRDQIHLETMFRYIEGAKSRVLLEQLADLPILKPAKVSQSLLDEEARWSNEIEKLEKLLMEGEENTIDLADRLASAHHTLSEVWTQIEQEDPYGGAEYVSLRRAAPLSVNDARNIVKHANKKAAIVEYYLALQHLIVTIVYSDKPTIDYRVLNVSREEVRELALVNPSSPPSLDLRIPYWQLDLAPLLIQPISEIIANYELICLVPHDVLHGIPLHALHISESDQRTLAQIANVVYIPSISMLKYCRNKPQQNHGNNLVFGNPTRNDMPEILQTRAEAEMVASILGCHAYIQDEATKPLFLKMSSKAEYIHLACHGEFRKDDALASALLLTGGDLTAREIFGLELRAELVVLSACETGIAENRSGDELIGLVRALLYAGVPSVIVSLWNAYDESTDKLMTIFYDKIIHQGLTKVEALALAQRELTEAEFSEVQWAPFILIGDWE